MRLAGKVALVTGAQQGIGKAIASQIRAMGQRAVVVAGDVAQAADVRRLVEAGTNLGGIDILVNNAGIFPRVEFLDMTEAQWDEVLNVNLKGTFLCTQAVAQKMVERG